MSNTFQLNGKMFCASVMSVAELVETVCNNTFADFESEKHVIHIHYQGERPYISESEISGGREYDGYIGMLYHNGHYTDWCVGVTTREGIRIIDTYYKYCN